MLDNLARAINIQCLVLDVDGVLTDGRLYYGEQGEIIKTFYVQDGLGIKLAQQAGITVAIISGRNSAIVQKRAAELNINHVYQGNDDKLPILDQLLTKLTLNYSQCAVIGDDLPDLPMIERVGLGIAVPNAVEAVKQQATWQTQREGGAGAVREVCDLLLAARQ
jgi:3-deoxy-D-manno-octulosonate 8-phosphate phosphatase (KDO 8-P phosphatase)